ncbi:hypothetical protein BASA61_007902 [Batrachochytrium salamandrivorans]|nr:hypothetical protein BASA60_003510 [Batrachochytrium salamandrivorans]KAH6583676.1 hypothetical protein BASA61_007902 [Batrachochytrium salamandrivorans]KAH9274656.1 hypothetical protein BASA83_002841 [Batrachochytrium salamandrivorans]
MADVEQGLIPDVGQKGVARKVASVESRKITVMLAVSQRLVHAIYTTLAIHMKYHLMAAVDYMLMPDVDQKDVARTMVTVGLRKSTVTLAVSQHLVSVYPTRISLDIRLAGNS